MSYCCTAVSGTVQPAFNKRYYTVCFSEITAVGRGSGAVYAGSRSVLNMQIQTESTCKSDHVESDRKLVASHTTENCTKES